jgi:hypothetical protein
METLDSSRTKHSMAVVQFGYAACAVFGGRFAAGSGLLSSPIASAIGFVGCTRSSSQIDSPKFRAPVKYPG